MEDLDKRMSELASAGRIDPAFLQARRLLAKGEGEGGQCSAARAVS
jgi:hypothetical protein